MSHVSSTHDDGDNDVISVRHEGRNLAREHLSRVCNPFKRIEPGIGSVAGTILGLTMVQEITLLGGRRLPDKNMHGCGSTFHHVVPTGRRWEMARR